MLTRAGRWGAEVGRSLAELILPAGCAGCGADREPLAYGACAGCAAALHRLVPAAACPYPVPAGLPRCVAVGGYDGVLREVLLAYKERGRHRLARPLGVLLAGAVVEVLGGRPATPVVLLPVPSTARAVRQRQGDHLARLTRHAAHRLRSAGWAVSVQQPLRALPRPDSALLDRAGRAAAAAAFLRLRPARLAALRRASAVGPVVVLDDVITTGATLAAVAGRLAEVQVPVAGAAVLAQTRLRSRTPAGGHHLPA